MDENINMNMFSKKKSHFNGPFLMALVVTLFLTTSQAFSAYYVWIDRATGNVYSTVLNSTAQKALSTNSLNSGNAFGKWSFPKLVLVGAVTIIGSLVALAVVKALFKKFGKKKEGVSGPENGSDDAGNTTNNNSLHGVQVEITPPVNPEFANNDQQSQQQSLFVDPNAHVQPKITNSQSLKFQNELVKKNNNLGLSEFGIINVQCTVVDSIDKLDEKWEKTNKDLQDIKDRAEKRFKDKESIEKEAAKELLKQVKELTEKEEKFAKEQEEIFLKAQDEQDHKFALKLNEEDQERLRKEEVSRKARPEDKLDYSRENSERIKKERESALKKKKEDLKKELKDKTEEFIDEKIKERLALISKIEKDEQDLKAWNEEKLEEIKREHEKSNPDKDATFKFKFFHDEWNKQFDTGLFKSGKSFEESKKEFLESNGMVELARFAFDSEFFKN